MAYKDFANADTLTRSQRGTTNRNLGATTITATKTVAPKPSVAGRIGSIASGGAKLVGEGLENLGRYTVNTPGYILNSTKSFLNPVARVVTGNLNQDINAIDKQRVQLDEQLDRFTQDYKSGKMSKANYTAALRQYGEGNRQLNKGATELETGVAKESQDFVRAAAETAALVLSGGRLQLSKPALSKTVLRSTSTAATNTATKNQVLKVILEQNGTKLEKAVTKIPAVRDLVYRNMLYLGKRESQRAAGESVAQYVGREGKELAIGMLLKRPILYQTNLDGAQEVYNKMIEGDLGDAATQSAWLGTQMLSGGPLGAASRGFGWLKGHSTKLAYGEGSFIDELSKGIGGQNSNQIAEYLGHLKKTGQDDELKWAERIFRRLGAVNMHMAGGDPAKAANYALQHWESYGIPLQGVTPKRAAQLFDNWEKADDLKNAFIKSGKFKDVNPEEAGKYVVVRWDNEAKRGLADKIEEVGDNSQQVNTVIQEWKLSPGNAAGQNDILMGKIEDIFNATMKEGGGGAKQLAKEIKELSAASIMTKDIPAALRKELSKLGFTVARPSKTAKRFGKTTPAIDYEDTPRLVTAVQNGDTEIFDIATATQPQLNFLARGLEKLGISPNETNAAANRVLSQNVVGKLDELGGATKLGFSHTEGADTITGGQVILSKLQRFIESMQPNTVGSLLVANRAVGPAVSDIRQLTNAEIRQALKVDRETAKAVQKAIVDGYAKVPMDYRGLGPKVVDKLYQINPLYKGYSRIQSAMRYTYNPFFRVQESVETALLSRAQARAPLWIKTKAELDEGAKILDNSGIFTTGQSGEAAQDLVLGRITANLTQGQKRNLAGLGYAMAKSRGISLEEMVQKYPDEVGDALRIIVQYPNKGVLNSSLARTLNVAFFPMRYNLKVTKLAAEILSREAPSVQLAVINSLFNMRDWLKSDEGIAWQSEHSEAIQTLKWLTPVGSIIYGLERLTRSPDSFGELGSLGGLPLGVITQMLDSQGIISLNTPYVDPKTGDVFPKYIPENTKARAATAVADLLNSMFTYPGRTLGLPGKNEMLNKTVRTFIATNGSDFEKRIRTEDLTPLQENWIRVLKGDTSEEAIDALYNSAAEGQFNWYTLPPLALPIEPPERKVPNVERRTNLPSKASQKKAKKEKPTALPLPS